MADVIKLDLITKLDLDPSAMLREIAKSSPVNVFVVVWSDSDTSFHASTGNIAEILLKLREFEYTYFSDGFEE